MHRVFSPSLKTSRFQIVHTRVFSVCEVTLQIGPPMFLLYPLIQGPEVLGQKAQPKDLQVFHRGEDNQPKAASAHLASPAHGHR